MILRLLLVSICGLLLASCAVVPGQAKRPEIVDPTCRCCFHEAEDCGKPPVSLAKLNPFWGLANHNRPYDPWFMPNAPHGVRKFCYALRNPGHNFTYHVIGVADRDFVRTGTHPETVWNPEGGTNWTMIHSGPLIHLPGVSHRGRFFEGYFGWRERGNFGIALRLGDRRDEIQRDAHPEGFGEDGEHKFEVKRANACVTLGPGAELESSE